MSIFRGSGSIPDRGRCFRRVRFAAAVCLLALFALTLHAEVFLRLPGRTGYGAVPAGDAAAYLVEERAVTVNGVSGRMGIFRRRLPLRSLWEALGRANGKDGIFVSGDRIAWGTVRAGRDRIRWMGLQASESSPAAAFALRMPRDPPPADVSMLPGWFIPPAGVVPELVVSFDDTGSALLVLAADGPVRSAAAAIGEALRSAGWKPMGEEGDSISPGAGLYLRRNRWAGIGAGSDERGRTVITVWIQGGGKP